MGKGGASLSKGAVKREALIPGRQNHSTAEISQTSRISTGASIVYLA